MDQISPPMRIVLAVAVVFLAAYMLVLRPKDETVQPAATPATPAAASAKDANEAQTSLGKAVESARGAKDAVESRQGTATSGETSSPSTTAAKPSAPKAAAKPKDKPADPALAKLPNWLEDSMDKKVVAILFTNGKAADDRRTRRALNQAFTANGKVVKRAVPISKIARYRPVAEGVNVQQSPTLMVIDRKRTARVLVGYSSLNTINQTIIDGLLATGKPVRTSAYLQKVRRECNQVRDAMVIGQTDGSSFAGAKKNLGNIIAVHSSSLGTLRNTPVPAKYKPLSRTVNGFLASQAAVYRTVQSVAVGGKAIDGVKVKSILRRNDRLEKRTSLQLAAVGVNACT